MVSGTHHDGAVPVEGKKVERAGRRKQGQVVEMGKIKIEGSKTHMSKLKQERSDGGDAFIPESAQISGTSDGVAELMAEQYLRGASGDECEEDTRDEEVPEELGGPFVESRSEKEFGSTRKAEDTSTQSKGTRQATTHPLRIPLPQAVGPLAVAGPDEDVDEGESASDRIGVEVAASDVRAAKLASERGSLMEPDIKIESPASEALKT